MIVEGLRSRNPNDGGMSVGKFHQMQGDRY